VSTFTPLLVLEQMAEQGNNSNSNTLDRSEVIASLSTQLQALLHFMKPDFSFGDHHRLGSHRWAFTDKEELVFMQVISFK
jgi:hypothetical protein